MARRRSRAASPAVIAVILALEAMFAFLAGVILQEEALLVLAALLAGTTVVTIIIWLVKKLYKLYAYGLR